MKTSSGSCTIITSSSSYSTTLSGSAGCCSFLGAASGFFFLKGLQITIYSISISRAPMITATAIAILRGVLSVSSLSEESSFSRASETMMVKRCSESSFILTIISVWPTPTKETAPCSYLAMLLSRLFTLMTFSGSFTPSSSRVRGRSPTLTRKVFPSCMRELSSGLLAAVSAVLSSR